MRGGETFEGVCRRIHVKAGFADLESFKAEVTRPGRGLLPCPKELTALPEGGYLIGWTDAGNCGGCRGRRDCLFGFLAAMSPPGPERPPREGG
jgi:hypothetical protein